METQPIWDVSFLMLSILDKAFRGKTLTSKNRSSRTSFVNAFPHGELEPILGALNTKFPLKYARLNADHFLRLFFGRCLYSSTAS